MSRHRNFRNIDLTDEFNDDEDYSNSYEDHYSVSPSSAQFMYNKNNVKDDHPKLHDYFGEESVSPGYSNDEPIEIKFNHRSDGTNDDYSRQLKSGSSTGEIDDHRRVLSPTGSTPTPPIAIKAPSGQSGKKPTKGYTGRASGPTRPSVGGTTSNSTYFKSAQSTPYLPNLAVDRLKIEDVSGGLSSGSSSPAQSRPESPRAGTATPRNQAAVRLKARPENARPVLNLVVVGHVDAGKSTLMGHFLYLIGQVNQKTIHKYKQDSQKLGKGSFAYAWVLDEGTEERSRGVTIDVARARFSTKKFDVALLDAPGHKDFIPNMISGAAEADAAILVVNATTGEFETGFDLGGQTREHTMLVRSLGVSQLVVAVNKLDTVNWSQQRFDDICAKMKTFLKQTGFSNALFVPCCGLNGENLIETPTSKENPSKKHPLMDWYQGGTLLEAIDKFKTPEKSVEAPLRLIISDVFKTITSSNPLIGGKIESGALQINDKVVIMPSGQTGVVKSIQTDESMESQAAFAGDQVIVCLSNAGDLLTNNPVTQGDVLCHPESPVPAVQRFQARMVFFNPARPITKGFPVVVHCNSNQRCGHISKLVSQVNSKTGEILKIKPRCFGKNSSGVVEITVEKPVCLQVYAENKDLGRVTLRAEGSTIAAGVVTKLFSTSASS